MKRKFRVSNKVQWMLSVILFVAFVAIVIIGNNKFQGRTFEPTEPNVVVKADEQKDNLKNKVMVAFGDSVTEFGKYPDIVSNNTKMKVYNIGFGGTRIAHHTDDYYDRFSLTRLLDAIETGDFGDQENAVASDNNSVSPKFKLHFKNLKNIDFTKVDFISIFLGTNDYMGTRDGIVPVGDIEDTTRETFNGGINYAVNKIREINPDI